MGETIPLSMSYQQLLVDKENKPVLAGFECTTEWDYMYRFQQHCTRLALLHGRYALFEGCGTGKTIQQCTWAKEVVNHTGGAVIGLAPLAVVEQTIELMKGFGIEVIKWSTEMCQTHELAPAIYITNYEQLDNIPAELFIGVFLDESSILKSFTGATKKQLIETFKNTPYRLSCTATPAPNDLNEIGNQAEFLGILDAQDMRAKWFVRDEGMNNYRLKGHAKPDFYSWMRTWCVMFHRPHDIGFPMVGYDLPDVKYFSIDIKTKGRDDGLLFNKGHVNATTFHKEVKLTMEDRLREVAAVANASDEQFIIWIEQNDEGKMLRKLIPGAVEVSGSDKVHVKTGNLLGFAQKKFRVLITKGDIAGFGMNYQQCRNMIFANPSFSFETIWQCICRIVRFGQKQQCNIWMVAPDTMENVVANYQAKERQYFETLAEMNNGINGQRYGLVTSYDFHEVKTDQYWLMKGDTVIESKRIPDNSAGLIIFSPPFSSLFTYSNYIHDMGNNPSHKAFFEQYRYLLEEDYRILQPGRLLITHVKNLGVYKNSSGYTGMYDFSGEHRRAVEAAGFKLQCIITIWTDPVLEMQRTKTQRLLYKTVTSDSSMSGVGMPEFLYVFKKWDGNQDEWEPVTSLNRQNFTLDMWQEWASPVYRENLMSYEKHDLVNTILAMKAENFRLKYGCNDGLPTHWYDDVWFDIKRTDVLNGKEGTDQGDEKHIAPLQLEVIRRCIKMWSNKGETVKTSFLGIGSEAFVAVEEDRKAIGIELKDSYFDTSVKNLRIAVSKKHQTTLF